MNDTHHITSQTYKFGTQDRSFLICALTLSPILFPATPPSAAPPYTHTNTPHTTHIPARVYHMHLHTIYQHNRHHPPTMPSLHLTRPFYNQQQPQPKSSSRSRRFPTQQPPTNTAHHNNQIQTIQKSQLTPEAQCLEA